MIKHLRVTSSIITAITVLSFCTSCVRVHSSCDSVVKAPKKDGDINVYTSNPTYRSYRETVRYEAIGSNITSFDRVLSRIKQQARRDGCEALVKVRFYKQPLGNGKYSSSFPKIEAVGVVFEDRED